MSDTLLEGLFPSDVRSAIAPIADHFESLRPKERTALAATALPRRREEFSTGRWLAHRLLAHAGEADPAIERGPDRAPIWPTGWLGSISHAGDRCAVVVASTRDYAGLGLDLELDAPVRAGLERMICFGRELDWLATAPSEAERLRRCRMVFSAKEAVYKAFYPRVRRVWRFAEVALELDLAREAFDARLPADAGVEAVRGRLRIGSGWILAGVAIPR